LGVKIKIRFNKIKKIMLKNNNKIVFKRNNKICKIIILFPITIINKKADSSYLNRNQLLKIISGLYPQKTNKVIVVGVWEGVP